MDAATLAQLRSTLEHERSQHMELLAQHGAEAYGESVKQLDVGNDGFADSGQATEERAEALASIEQARERIHLIDEALERMDAGDYGICTDCGNAISPDRLEVRPLSVKCVSCASKS